MSNRAYRRQMMREETKRNQKLTASFSKEQKIAGLIQNGITAKDLEEEFERGRELGFKQAAIPVIKSCYAGICIALHDEFGFGQERCYRALRAVDEKVLWSLSNTELIDEVLEKTGLELDLDEPFDRVIKASERKQK